MNSGFEIMLPFKAKMEVEVDQFGKPLFQPDEFLKTDQIRYLVASFQQETKAIECTICQKKFSKQSNLSHHFKMQHMEHVEHENKVTPKAKAFVKEIFDVIPLMGRSHRKDVSQEIRSRMQNGVDESGEPLFKSNEILDIEQIDTILFNIMQSKMKNKKKKRTEKLFDINIKTEGVTESKEDVIVTVSKMRQEHPIKFDNIVICDLANTIMNSKVNEPSPLAEYENDVIISIGKLVGVEVLEKHLEARDRKKDAKFREIETAVVTYVTQNCSCYETM